MIIMKFGGTSVGSAERIVNVANIVKSHLKKKPVVVVSAVTKMTDALIRLARECAEGNGSSTLNSIKKTHYSIMEKLKISKSLLDKDFEELENLAKTAKNAKNIGNQALDHFQSFGERMSSKIVAEQLKESGMKAQAFNSWDLGFLTDSEFGDAEPLEVSYKNLNNSIKKLKIVPVITGFIGKTENNEITTLGRGGSDYSAAIIGAAINAREIQIWTDVNGIMTTDPKIAANARTIEKISFAEAAELAYFGAKVLHPKTILPAMNRSIPVKVLNSFEPKQKGTTILKKAPKNSRVVEAIACKKKITLVHVDSTRMLDAYGFMARLFDVLDKYKKNIDVIATSEVSVSLTIDDTEGLESMLREIKNFADVEVLSNRAIICVVGEGMRNTPGISGRTFMALGRNKINIEMISQGASEINITFIVNGRNCNDAVKILHKEYFG